MTTGDHWKPVAIDKKASREMLIIEKKKKRVDTMKEKHFVRKNWASRHSVPP